MPSSQTSQPSPQAPSVGLSQSSSTKRMSCRVGSMPSAAQAAEIELLAVGRRRLQDHLELVIVLQPVRVLAIAAVRRPARGLHIGGAPRLGPERAQRRRRMEGAGAHLHVVGLQDHAALLRPVSLQRQDQRLEAGLGIGRGAIAGRSASSGDGRLWCGATYRPPPEGQARGMLGASPRSGSRALPQAGAPPRRHRRRRAAQRTMSSTSAVWRRGRRVRLRLLQARASRRCGEPADQAEARTTRRPTIAARISSLLQAREAEHRGDLADGNRGGQGSRPARADPCTSP